MTENDLANHRLSPAIPPSPMAGQGLVRLPRVEPMAASIPSRPVSFPRLPPNAGVRASIQPADANKVKQTGEKLQNMMLRHQRPPVTKPAPAQASTPAPTSTPLPLRQQPRQRSAGDVTPLRRPLPPEGPLPLKPKRPPNVNLEPYQRFNQGPALPGPRKLDGETLKLIRPQICNHVSTNKRRRSKHSWCLTRISMLTSLWLNVCKRLARFAPFQIKKLTQNN